MFGYIKVYQPELKMREYELYKGVYCALCETLGKRYGLAARMTLSYDFTFLALFLMALSDDEIGFSKGRCSFHPTKKKTMCGESPALDYAADVAMLLTYHKLSDTIADESFFKRLAARIGRMVLRRDYRRAVSRRPEEAQAALRYMQYQAEAERVNTPLVDAAAEPTATFLGVLASSTLPKETEEHETATRFGYCLGRFIYLADAADDLKDDLQNGNYNPYIACDSSVSLSDPADMEKRRCYAAESLYACAAVCAECYEQLPIKRFDGILRNVLYYGMPSVIRRITQRTREDDELEKSV